MLNPESTPTVYRDEYPEGDTNQAIAFKATPEGLKTMGCITVPWEWILRAYFEANREKLKATLSDGLSETGTQPDGGIDNVAWRYCAWSPGNSDATLDSEFTAHQLLAIGFWMLYSKD